MVYPSHRLVKARKVRTATRRLQSRLDDYHAGRITFAELDASMKGWINHVAHADSCAVMCSSACRLVRPNAPERWPASIFDPQKSRTALRAVGAACAAPLQ